MKRLQVVLDEMRIWEREIFDKEYADANWFKGKQRKHGHEMEMARRRTDLGLLFFCPCFALGSNDTHFLYQF
jgi:5'-3' exoribonuclease 1